MDDAANPTPTSSSSSAAAAAAAAAAQHQQLQRQIFLMQQAQAQSQSQGHAPTPQQLSQQAMSRFPSNIDAHLRPLGPIRFQQPPQPQPQPPQPPPSQPQQQQQQQQHSGAPSPSQSQASPQQQQQQQQQQAAAMAAAAARVRSPEVEMALQDAMRVCNPDIKTPFQSIEDAVNRAYCIGNIYRNPIAFQEMYEAQRPPYNESFLFILRMEPCALIFGHTDWFNKFCPKQKPHHFPQIFPSSQSTSAPTMDAATNYTPTSSASTVAQNQLHQRQIFLMQQAQAQAQAQGQGHTPTPQQLSQQAMSFFPSNIDAHLPLPGPDSTPTSSASTVVQNQLHQRQIFLMQQAQAQAQAQGQGHTPTPQQLSQQAMSFFPSNIDAHLPLPGPIRFQQPLPQQPPPLPQQQPQQIHSWGPSLLQSWASLQQQQQAAVAAVARVQSPEVEMALQDVMQVCNPDIKTPFQSVKDAVNRLLPYHVVADYEAEEDDRILDSDTTGQIPSRLQQWDHNILVKIAEFTTTFEKQVLAYNIMTKKRAIGEFRSEERLMLEQALLMEEKQAMMGLRAQIESREKAGREAAEAKMRMAMAEQARAEAQAHSEMIGHGPLRAHAAASQGEDGPSHEMMQEQGEDGWGNAQRDDEDPSEDFLNDENEPENGNSDMQEDWRRSGELDLNSR
uniref:GLTSCR protein conserved domain-containing protein n=1 Tax=Oryza glumipatula TaxID=40148 RepID=A0A0E0BSI3_9ORYZ